MNSRLLLLLLVTVAAVWAVWALQPSALHTGPSPIPPANSATNEEAIPAPPLRREVISETDPLTDTLWTYRPDLCEAMRNAYRRIQYEEGGEERALLLEESRLKTKGGEWETRELREIPDRMDKLGMVPMENMEGMLAEVLAGGRISLGYNLGQQINNFLKMQRIVERGDEYHIPLYKSLLSDPPVLSYPPETFLLHFTGKPWQEFDVQVLRDLGAIRDRHVRHEALLHQEQTLMDPARFIAKNETGISFTNDYETAWRAILPEFDKLQSELEENQLQYEDEIRIYLMAQGFSIVADESLR